ncbi:acetyltransferase [Chryseolinea soli]|uniref:Acetyltransferase n=1 Tax=Chryseolinea soli TaxID=2321403 RepID=A0A385SQH4_9BACT|nr:acetyltransferase [Chryseolinea soli]AYB33102.1 acetyltransferase [Chryseolinea soli]
MKRLAIIGSGDLGQQIAYHAREDGHYEPAGFFDDFEAPGTVKHGVQVWGGVNDVLATFERGAFDCLMIGIGYNHMAFRQQLYERFRNTVPFGKVIHSSSYIDKSASVGSGVFIYPGCVLDMDVEIKDNALLNVGCTIAHHSTVGEGSFLSPGVKVAGFTEISGGVILGIGTIVIDNIKIAPGVRTAGGAVVIDHLDRPGLYAGVPAQFKK